MGQRFLVLGEAWSEVQCRTYGAPQSWRSVSQPFRAGLKFGYRPYGPGSDSESSPDTKSARWPTG
jgi:hypothetical protein